MAESIGRHTYKSSDIRVQTWSPNDGKLRIGSFCSIGSNLNVKLGGNHFVDQISTFPFCHPMHPFAWWNPSLPVWSNWSKGDVVIGNDVWVGDDVTILSGVTIGDGAVVGACSVVAKNVPPYSIVVGNPIEIKKYRFSDQQIESLLKIKWWEWDDEKIASNAHLLASKDIDDFISLHLIQ